MDVLTLALTMFLRRLVEDGCSAQLELAGCPTTSAGTRVGVGMS